MTLKEKIKAKKFAKQTLTIKQYVNDWYTKINCLPVGQRLPVAIGPEKREGIIRSILLGIDIGQITLVENSDDIYNYESVDGGHRKRYIWDYIQNKFSVDGKYFNQLDQEKQKAFLNYEIVFSIYEPLDVYTKGYIFRALNETTKVEHQEMLNSYGNIPIANFIRELVRSVSGVNNTTHELFECSLIKNNAVAYEANLDLPKGNLLSKRFILNISLWKTVYSDFSSGVFGFFKTLPLSSIMPFSYAPIFFQSVVSILRNLKA